MRFIFFVLMLIVPAIAAAYSFDCGNGPTEIDLRKFKRTIYEVPDPYFDINDKQVHKPANVVVEYKDNTTVVIKCEDNDRTKRALLKLLKAHKEHNGME